VGSVEELRGSRVLSEAGLVTGHHRRAPGLRHESRHERRGRHGLQLLHLRLETGKDGIRRRLVGRRRDQHQGLVRGAGLPGGRYEQHNGLGDRSGTSGVKRLLGRLLPEVGREFVVLIVFRLLDQLVRLVFASAAAPATAADDVDATVSAAAAAAATATKEIVT